VKGGGAAEVSAVVKEVDWVSSAPHQRIRIVRSGRLMKLFEDGKRAELWIGATPQVVIVNLADEGTTWCYGWTGEAVDALNATLVMEKT